MKVSRKKLNNKGFTLIELLAVVVILAIVMGIAISSGLLGTVSNSRRTLLLSNAKKSAVNLNTWVSADMEVMDSSEKKLGHDFSSATMNGEWICLNESLTINNGGDSTTLMKALGLSSKDIVVGTNFIAETKNDDGVATGDPSCSAIRYDSYNGGYELLLVASPDGKYYVAEDKVHFAYSSASAINESID